MKQIANVEIIRLKALADMLDDVQENQFDLKSWVTSVPRRARTMLLGLVETDPGCGFAGCAMGWAAYNNLFPNFFTYDKQVYLKDASGNHHQYRDWAAVMKLLGINHRMALYLFGALSYKQHATTTVVANRIRHFVGKIEALRARDRRRIMNSTDISDLVRFTQLKNHDEMVASLS
jgi:hypothetical protein